MDLKTMLGLNLAVSVIVPLILGHNESTTFSSGENIILGVLLFLSLSIVELLSISKEVTGKIKKDFEIWQTNNEIDTNINEVRRLIHKVEELKYGDNDLFSCYFKRKVENLKRSLDDAVNKKEVRVEETMMTVTSDLMGSSFEGRDVDVFRALHYCSSNDFFFGVHAKRYFRQVYDLVEQNRIQLVRRLIVYNDKTELEDPYTKRLVAFHANHSSYDYKLLVKKDFERILKDYNLHQYGVDFGVYGERYLYKGFLATSSDIVGSYSKDRNEIEKYIECFETCWSSPSDTYGIEFNSDEAKGVDITNFFEKLP